MATFHITFLKTRMGLLGKPIQMMELKEFFILVTLAMGDFLQRVCFENITRFFDNLSQG